MAFFVALALLAAWDMYHLCKEKNKRLIVVYLLITALVITAGILMLGTDYYITTPLKPLLDKIPKI